MEFESLVEQLEKNGKRLIALAGDLDTEAARWKPDEKTWSMLEIMAHMLDIEREDFRVLLDLSFHHPGKKRDRIAPEAWVTERKYNERDLTETLADFANERADSLAWLRNLESPDWDLSYEMPWGTIRTGDVMAAWAAHDILHMRQMVKLLWLKSQTFVPPYSTQYAGEW